MQKPLAQSTVDLTRYAHLFWRYKWLVVLPAVVMPLLAGYRSMQFQDQFKSTTLILVQPQKVPTDFVPSTITTGIAERLQTISQQIFSRTRLEQIIQEFNLFAREKKDQTPEEVVNLMRSRIDLKVHRNDAFQLSFIDANPRLAMLVTNKLASLFIEENLKVREQQAIGTSQFLGDEIERYREKVRERERLIYEFKRQHMPEMPEQMSSNQSRLGQLQNQLQINSQNINAAQSLRMQLQQQIAEVERRVEEQAESGAEPAAGLSISDMLAAQFPSAGESGNSGMSDSNLRGLEEGIAKREDAVRRMLLKYTEKHPDVLHLQAEIEQLRQEAQAQRARLEEERTKRLAEAPAPSPVEAAPSKALPSSYPPIYDQLKADILRAEAEISRLVAQSDGLQRDIEVYQARIAATPARQLQLQQLSEDYGNLKSVLDSLIDKKLQADLAENLERKQKGEQFQILDPANLPVKPFYPNRLRWVGGGFVLGLALGAGLILAVDLLSLGIKTRNDLVNAIDAPVLAAIPEIQTPMYFRRRRLWRLVLSGATAACLLVAAGVVHWTVKPLPDAARDLFRQVRATHWTTMRDMVVERR